jgi:hypothetical protein
VLEQAAQALMTHEFTFAWLFFFSNNQGNVADALMRAFREVMSEIFRNEMPQVEGTVIMPPLSQGFILRGTRSVLCPTEDVDVL